MHRLIFDESPLVVSPSLATKIGLNEAIILQQIYYWTQKSDKIYEGNSWTYNTYSEWKLQFPWWSERTIQRIILDLEDKNLIISGNFNKLKIDKTKWYRINYDVLDNLSTQNSHDAPNWHHGHDKLAHPSRQVGTMHDDKLALPLPETNTKTTTDINSMSEKSQIPENSSRGSESIAQIILDHFNTVFQTRHGKGALSAITKQSSKKKNSSLLDYWLDSYSLEEIKQAITNAREDKWWFDKLTPVILFRKENPQHEPVDYIGKFLNMSPTQKKVEIKEISDMDIWLTAKEKNVPWKVVNEKANRINTLIGNGEFERKYASRTPVESLRYWIDIDISKGFVSHCNEIDLMDLDMMHPSKVAARAKLDKIKQQMIENGDL